MVVKYKLKIVILFVLLVTQISFIASLDAINIGEIMGLPEETKIIGIGVEYQELEDERFRITFVEENAEVNINGNLFTDIIPQEDAGHPTYIELDENGEIVKADFTTNDKGGNYTFGDNTIEVPPNSRVFFDKDTGIEIKISDETDLTEFPNLLKYISDGYLTTIKGKDIILPNGINLVDGELSIEEKGYFLENGEAIYKQNFLKIYEDEEKILIANPDADLSDYGGNWIRQNSNILEIQSSERSFIEVEFLENHEILNTDSKDRLSASIWKGDGLIFEERTEEGLIPKAVHKSSEGGESIIQNDKLEFTFENNKFSISPPVGLLDEDFSKKYQSVAFEIESDSDKINEKIRVNSYRQFVILSEDDKELITYNKYGLPISANIKDNELQTLQQLRNKYPEVEFEVFGSMYVIEGPFGPMMVEDESSTFKNETNFPPYLLYLTDEFLKSHPGAVEDVKRWEYRDEFKSYSTKDLIISLGRMLVDPSELTYYLKKPARGGVSNPFQVLIHEYEHLLDSKIDKNEFELLKTLNNPKLNYLLKDELDPFEEFKVREYYSKEYPKKKMLRQLYNELVINSVKDISSNKEFNQLFEPFSKSLASDVGEKLNQMLNEAWGKDIISISIENGFFETEGEALEAYENDPLTFKKMILDDINLDLRIDLKKEEDAKTVERLHSIIKSAIFLRDTYPKDRDEAFSSGSHDYWGEESTYGEAFVANIKKLYSNGLFAEPDLIDKSNQFTDLIKSSTGLTDIHALTDYTNYETILPHALEDTVSLQYPDLAMFYELSSTYREQPIETRKMGVHSANPLVSEMYKSLTQLAFDSGKMDAEKFKTIMGEEHCKKEDCSDKLCVEYKLLCCEEHPESPNC